MSKPINFEPLANMARGSISKSGKRNKSRAIIYPNGQIYFTPQVAAKLKFNDKTRVMFGVDAESKDIFLRKVKASENGFPLRTISKSSIRCRFASSEIATKLRKLTGVKGKNKLFLEIKTKGIRSNKMLLYACSTLVES